MSTEDTQNTILNLVAPLKEMNDEFESGLSKQNLKAEFKQRDNHIARMRRRAVGSVRGKSRDKLKELFLETESLSKRTENAHIAYPLGVFSSAIRKYTGYQRKSCLK